jgi:hypothetical protein
VAATHTQDNTNTKYTYTDIHDSSGLRTHDPSAGGGEDCSCLRPRGQCDQRCYDSNHSKLPVKIKNLYIYIISRDSVIGRATGYGLHDRVVGVRVPVGSRIFSSPRRPDRLWGPPSLLSNGYRGLFSRG